MFNNDYAQHQFIVYELVLPYCSVCTPIATESESWYTPLLCEESSDSEYSLFFTKSNSPLMSPPSTSIAQKSALNSSVFKCVESGTEDTATLKPSEGLASRSTMKVNCVDFNADPGPINFTTGGTFFGKLEARNILEGKKIITHYYSMVNEVVTEIRTSVHYITGTNLSAGKFTIEGKDALKDAEEYSESFPAVTEATLDEDITATDTIIPVTDGTVFVAGDIIRIDKELMLIESIDGNNLTVATRGQSLTSGEYTIYKTDTAAHDDETSVQICYQNNQGHISEVLKDIFVGIGLEDIVDETQWYDEIEEWNIDSTYIGLITEPTEAVDLINEILINYMLDMWLDQETQKLVISAVSAWKEEQRVLTEGVDFTNLAITKDSSERYSRALIYHQKDYKTEDDDLGNYSKWTIYKDESLETSDFYGSATVKEFDPCPFITSAAANVLVARYVQRFSETPKTITFDMEERKVEDIRLGTIVDLVTRESQTASGEYLQASDRVQIIEMNPNLNTTGRSYSMKGLSYIPLISSDPSQELYINVSGSVFDLDLYSRAGNPNGAINVTFLFNDATIGSTGYATPSVRAGSFETGTRIRIICTGTTKWSARGGDGGDSVAGSSNSNVTAGDGLDGADCYWSDGIETEIYLNYSDVDGYSPSGTLYAAGGGGGAGSAAIYLSFTGFETGNEPSGVRVGIGGSGGNGIPAGIGGTSSVNTSNVESYSSPGNDSTFSTGGAGIYKYLKDTVSGRPSYYTEADASGGKGGDSVGGSNGSGSTDRTTQQASVSQRTSTFGSGGDAGGALIGANITLYNTSSSLFKEGNSDAYTLVSS